MPTSLETVRNTKLTGVEVRKILEAKISTALQMDGMLAPHVAYGRIGCEVTVKLHLDNISYPEHQIKIKTQKKHKDDPVESAPLANPPATDQAIVTGTKASFKIDNPNKERIKHGLGIPIERLSRTTGHTEQAEIRYTPEEAGIANEPDETKYEDVSDKVKGEWE